MSLKHLKFISGRVENIMRKGENAGLPAFSPFLMMFSKSFCFKVVKICDCRLKS